MRKLPKNRNLRNIHSFITYLFMYSSYRIVCVSCGADIQGTVPTYSASGQHGMFSLLEKTFATHNMACVTLGPGN